MWLLMLEAGCAGLLLIFIVWWTMFASPRPHHPPSLDDAETPQPHDEQQQEPRH